MDVRKSSRKMKTSKRYADADEEKMETKPKLKRATNSNHAKNKKVSSKKKDSNNEKSNKNNSNEKSNNENTNNETSNSENIINELVIKQNGNNENNSNIAKGSAKGAKQTYKFVLECTEKDIHLGHLKKYLKENMEKICGRRCKISKEIAKIHIKCNKFIAKQKNYINRSSGASDEELSELKVWLTNVAKLEEAKPTKQLKSLYSRKDRNDGEAIRKRALEGVADPFQREKILEELEIGKFDESVNSDSASASEKSKKQKFDKKDDLDDFDFGPGPGHGKPTNSKKEMIRYLENKSEVQKEIPNTLFRCLSQLDFRIREIHLRKEELRLREKEADAKAKEIEMKREAKEKKHEIERMKAEAEIEDRKKMMDLLIKIATEKKG